jgi:hypothetical protein
MDTAQISELVRETFGKAGRVRLPSAPPGYLETDSVEEITPLQAMTWIAATWAKYPDARNFYPTKLEKIISYAREMEQGAWEFRPEGDPICITDGIVTGGRHRLHAILLSHRTIKSNIKYKTTKE